MLALEASIPVALTSKSQLVGFLQLLELLCGLGVADCEFCVVVALDDEDTLALLRSVFELGGDDARCGLLLVDGLKAEVLGVDHDGVELALLVLDDADGVTVRVNALGDLPLEAVAELEAIALCQLVSAVDVVVYGFLFALFLLLLSLLSLFFELLLELLSSLLLGGVVVRHRGWLVGGWLLRTIENRGSACSLGRLRR